MEFEQKKFVRIASLMERWDCSRDLVYELVSKGVLLEWHPEADSDGRGKRIEVQSILRVEARGYLNAEVGQI